MKKHIIIFSLISLFIIMPAFSFFKAVEIEGDVKIKENGVFISLRKNDPLYAGEEIKTGHNGSVKFIGEDDTVLTINPSTHFKLSRLNRGAVFSGTTVDIDLFAGKIDIKIGRVSFFNSYYKIHTLDSYLETSRSGAEFSVSVIEDNYSYAKVLSGSAWAYSKEGKRVVIPENHFFISKDMTVKRALEETIRGEKKIIQETASGLSLKISEPENNSVTNIGRIIIQGVSAPYTLITVQERSVYSGPEGYFTAMAELLKSGVNEINIRAEKSGIFIDEKLNIYYDTVPPSLNLMSDIPQRTNKDLIKISGVKETGAKLYINGVAVTSFTEFFSCEIKLNEGGNNVVIQAADEAGNITQKAFLIVKDTERPDINYHSISDTLLVLKLSKKSDVYIDGRLMFENTDEVSADISLFNQGGFIKILLEDKAGNKTERNLPLFSGGEDNIPPEILSVDFSLDKNKIPAELKFTLFARDNTQLSNTAVLNLKLLEDDSFFEEIVLNYNGRFYEGVFKTPLSFKTGEYYIASVFVSDIYNNFKEEFFEPEKYGFNLINEPPPAPELNLRQTASGVILTFSSSASVKEYHIYRKKTNADYVLHSITNINSFIDSGELDNEVYFYKVHAVDLAGQKSQGSEKSIRYYGVRRRPRLPENINGEIRDGRVYIEWEAPEDASIAGYYVYKTDPLGGALTLVANIDNPDQTSVILRPEAPEEYYIVKSYDFSEPPLVSEESSIIKIEDAAW